MLLTPPPKQNPWCKFAVFNLGFRIFFLAATTFAVLSMLLWGGAFFTPQVYFNLFQPFPHIPSIYWHAHEMLFGYAIALIAGFTLTAVKNWTHQQTPYSIRLCVLFTTWLIARIGFNTQIIPIEITVFFDLVFGFWLTYEFTKPIMKTRQWKQVSLAFKMLLITLFNTLFYLGMIGIIPNGQWLGILGGLLIVIALVITMGRRIIAFFIEKGVDGHFVAKNPIWIDRWGLVIYLLFTLFALFMPQSIWLTLSALALFIMHSIRLKGWYTPLLWGKPLLWSLWLGYAGITVGFLFYALTPYQPYLLSLALHSFALGGLGLIGTGMMARVSLGHSGRNVFEPPKIVGIIFALIGLSYLFRVVLPGLLPEQFGLWIGIAQIGWILGFALFVFTYFKMLTTPRIDGQWG